MATRVPKPKKASRPAALNMPMPTPDALALLGHLGLREADLGADQLGDLGGELVDEGAERGVGACRAWRWLTCRFGHAWTRSPSWTVQTRSHRARPGAVDAVRRPRRLPRVAGRIREEDIAEVREKARIDDVVSSYVTLRNAGGGSMKGLCPFHDEKSPVLPRHPLARLLPLLRLPGRRRRHQLRDGDGRPRLHRDRRAAGREGRRPAALRGGWPRPPRAAVRSGRGWSRPTRSPPSGTPSSSPPRRRCSRPPVPRLPRVRRRRGRPLRGRLLARAGARTCCRHLRQKGFTDEELVTSGLIGSGRGLYDRFRGRLMWPIRDSSGDTIGFGARRIFDDDRIEAKYLNTPETPIYKKSQVLYGIDLARREIARASQAVIVEGYTDVMACHLAGVKTAVATCGTAFGDDHARVDPPAAARPRRVPRRGDLHLRRRRGRPEGRAARLRGRPDLRRPDLRRGRADRHGPLRPAAEVRATPRCASWSPAGCRSTASCWPTWCSATTSTAPTAASTRCARRPSW